MCAGAQLLSFTSGATVTFQERLRFYHLLISLGSVTTFLHKLFSLGIGAALSPPEGDAAARLACSSVGTPRFKGASRRGRSWSRGPGQVFGLSRLCVSHGGTVPFEAVNNAARFPCSARGLSTGQSMRRSSHIYIHSASCFCE